MELFSKRYSPRDFTRSSSIENEDVDFIPPRLKVKLQSQIKYIINSNQYLEPFLIVDNQEGDRFNLHKGTLKDLSFRELGYDLTIKFDCNDLSFDKFKCDDFSFFDLLELLIIFSKSSRRDDLKERIGAIFEEEGNEFYLQDFMVVKRDSMSLRSLVPLLKDQLLKQKLKEFYSHSYSSSTPDYEVLARISADVVQRLFSSPAKKSETKNFAENLCKRTAVEWTDKKNVEPLKQLLNNTVNNIKAFNNQISNIRHTDRHTITLENPTMYKLIATQNIVLAELIIVSTPSEYVLRQNPDHLKSEYLEKYNVANDWETAGWVKKKKEVTLDDLPF